MKVVPKKTEFFVRIKDQFIRVRKLNYTDRIERPTLVFLHDALGSIMQWREFPLRLASVCHLNAIIYDRQGHGQSAGMSAKRTNAYLHEEALEYLPLLLSELEIDHPFLIGHSDGGSIAFIYGSRYQPAGIITIAAHVMLEDITLRGIRKALQKEDRIKEKLYRFHGTKMDALFSAWINTWLDPSFRNMNLFDELKNINAPVLAIQGTVDSYGSAEQLVQISKNLKISHRTEMIKDAGHNPHLQYQVQLINLLSAFIIQNTMTHEKKIQLC